MQSVVDIDKHYIFVEQIVSSVTTGIPTLECSAMDIEHDREQGATCAIRSDLETPKKNMTLVLTVEICFQ